MSFCKHAQNHELGKRACADRGKRCARLGLRESEALREENRVHGSEGVKTEQIEKACRVGAARAFVRDRCTNVLNPFGGGKRVTAFGRVLVSGR